jgi:N4-(beta-N-acetylglucosaminyl)-L-asparaginase
MVYYILRKDGAYAGISLWSGDKTGHVRQFTIADAASMRRTEDCLSLFECGPLNACSAVQI